MSMFKMQSSLIALVCHLLYALAFPQEVTKFFHKNDVVLRSPTILESSQHEFEDLITVGPRIPVNTLMALASTGVADQSKDLIQNAAMNIQKTAENVTDITINRTEVRSLDATLNDTSSLFNKTFSNGLRTPRQVNTNGTQGKDSNKSSVNLNIDTAEESSKVEETGGQPNRQSKKQLFPASLLHTGLATARQTAHNIGDFASSQFRTLNGAVRETSENLQSNLPPSGIGGLFGGGFPQANIKGASLLG